MRHSLSVALFVLVAVSFVYASSAARALETNAKQAVLLDFETGVELYSKNADELMPPASMTKMMTVYLLFERLAEEQTSRSRI